MYLNSSKRYSGRRSRRSGCISPFRILFWLVCIVLIVIGVGIYQNREMLTPVVGEAVANIVDDANERVATVNTPPPTPTQDPTNDLQRAEESWRRGAIQDAVGVYQRISDVTPNDLTVHYRLAMGLVMQGRMEEALEAAEDAITAQPFAADAWSIRAMALNRLGRYGEALASAQRALELVPQSAVEGNPDLAPARARAQAFLAEAYLNTGQVDRARTTAQAAIDAYPDSFEAYHVRGVVNQLGYFDFDAARRDFATAYEMAPNMLYVGIWLARIERDRFDNIDTMLQIYQDIVEQNPGNTQALFDLGDYYFRREGNYGEAAGYLSRCIQSNPNSASCYYLLGRAQIALEQTGDAQSSFRTAVELNDSNGYHHYWLGETYRLSGQCDQALPYYQNGYRIGTENDIDDLISAAANRLGECGSPVIFPTDPADDEFEDDGFEDDGTDA